MNNPTSEAIGFQQLTTNVVHHGPSGTSHVVGTRQELEEALEKSGTVVDTRLRAVFPTAAELVSAAEFLEAGSPLTPDGDLIAQVLRKLADEHTGTG